ncbi:MAG: hypothetical protein V9H69_06585 [Anaerolineae bacterium]
MNLTWQRLRGRTCDTCAFLDIFRSNGDGQVTRLHAFCRGPQSPFYDRPAPPERTCRGLAEIQWAAPSAAGGRSQPDRVTQLAV